MTLDFAGRVKGDAVAGKVSAGAFGSSPFTDERTSP
jgi:hypothetical protein